jgi:hypothetical protein
VGQCGCRCRSPQKTSPREGSAGGAAAIGPNLSADGIGFGGRSPADGRPMSRYLATDGRTLGGGRGEARRSILVGLSTDQTGGGGRSVPIFIVHWTKGMARSLESRGAIRPRLAVDGVEVVRRPDRPRQAIALNFSAAWSALGGRHGHSWRLTNVISSPALGKHVDGQSHAHGSIPRRPAAVPSGSCRRTRPDPWADKIEPVDRQARRSRKRRPARWPYKPREIGPQASRGRLSTSKYSKIRSLWMKVPAPGGR